MRNWLVFLHGNAALSLWPARCGPGPPPAHNAARDRMMVDYLRAGAEALHARSAEDLKSAEDWRERRPRLQQEYLYMVGLWPLPAKTPLAATITRSMQRDGFVVDMIHYQSRPGLYVTGNLYRPAVVQHGEPVARGAVRVAGTPAASGTATRPPTSHGIWSRGTGSCA